MFLIELGEAARNEFPRRRKPETVIVPGGREGVAMESIGVRLQRTVAGK